MNVQERLAQLNSKQKIIAGSSVGCAVLFLFTLCAGGIGVGVWKMTAAPTEQERIAKEKEKAQKQLEEKIINNILGKGNLPDKSTKKPKFELAPGGILNLDGIKVQILSGHIGKIKYFHQSGGRFLEESSKKKYHYFKFRIANDTDNFILDYLMPSSEGFVFVKDEFGNSYDTWHSQFANYPSPNFDRKLRPGKSLDDVFGFEDPLPNAKEFTIEFSNNTFNRSNERIQFKIPRTFFEETK